MVNNNGDGNDCLEPQMDSLLYSSLQFSILYWLQQIRAWVNWHPTLVQTVERHVWAHVRYILSICMCLSTHTKRNFTNIRFLHGWSVSLFFLIYFLFKKTDFVMRRWAKVSFFFLMLSTSLSSLIHFQVWTKNLNVTFCASFLTNTRLSPLSYFIVTQFNTQKIIYSDGCQNKFFIH